MKDSKNILSTEYEQLWMNRGYDLIVGCDEVGRGCLAGPVVAAAVALPRVESEKFQVIKSAGVRDSKLLNAKQREERDVVIRENCLGWGIGSVEPEVVDEINIHQATLLAMRRAVENILQSVSCESADRGTEEEKKNILLVVDGKFIPFGPSCDQEKNIKKNFHMKQEAIVDGDAKIFSIAAASIVAKVYRDTLVMKLDELFPEYGFARHKGYGTLQHRTAIRKYGLTRIHRRTFCKNF